MTRQHWIETGTAVAMDERTRDEMAERVLAVLRDGVDVFFTETGDTLVIGMRCGKELLVWDCYPRRELVVDAPRRRTS
jgi:hypothetical protein